MSPNQRRFFSGSNLDSAVMQAARHYGLAPEEVAYRKVEKKHGFLRARRAVVIEVDPEAPRKAPGSQAGSPTAERPTAAEPPTGPPTDLAAPGAESPAVLPTDATDPTPAPPAEREEAREARAAEAETAAPEAAPIDAAESAVTESQEAEDESDLIEAAGRSLQDIFAFAELELESEIRSGDGELEIELTGPDRVRLIEDRGNLLLSIQHLLPRLIRGYAGRSIPCHVDSESFHENREVELRQLAEEAAAEVRQRQQSRTLPPMNPAERRIIHVALAEDKDLNTESQGRGFFKRVTISPAMRRPRGFDRYNR